MVVRKFIFWEATEEQDQPGNYICRGYSRRTEQMQMRWETAGTEAWRSQALARARTRVWLDSHLIHHHQRPHHQHADATSAPAEDDCLQIGLLSNSVQYPIG